MRTLRTLIIGLVALSVATLPVAAKVAHAHPSEAPHAMAQPDCCAHDQSCAHGAMTGKAQDHGAGHCSDRLCKGGCMCLGVTAVLPGAFSSPCASLPPVKAERPAEVAASLTYIPPAPPPRV